MGRKHHVQRDVTSLFSAGPPTPKPKYNILLGKDVIYVTASERIVNDVRNQIGQYAKGKWTVQKRR